MWASQRMGIALCMLVGMVGTARGVQPVALQNATSTYTQGAELWGPDKTIDGIASGSFTSWAISRPDGSGDTAALAEAIVWETVTDLSPMPGELVKFTLCHRDFIPAPDHNIGRFRLAYTTDDRGAFADGVGIGGDVDANWTVIRPLAVQSNGGEGMFILNDRSILVQGGINSRSIYTLVAHIGAAGITGFRLDVLEHKTLAFRGPGRQATNGNLHLSEFKVEVARPHELTAGSC